jgi:hypothetical protein
MLRSWNESHDEAYSTPGIVSPYGIRDPVCGLSCHCGLVER